jgi:hypothetical protein
VLRAEQRFFDFVKEREQVRLRKEADLPFPWTEDTILQTYKFTNVRRHHDTTSKELRNRFYTPNYDGDRRTLLMNAATFRYFGTWEFAASLGWTNFEDMNDDHWEWVKELAELRLKERKRVFTGAYVITNQGISAPKQEVVVDYFLKGLQATIPEIMKVVQKTNRWEDVAEVMREVAGFGGSGFMTKEVLLDTTYTGFWETKPEYVKDGPFSFPSDWWSWTPIGPGARRGASRVCGDDEAKPLKESKAGQIIDHLYFSQDSQEELQEIIDGQLAPHDIQFQLCEFDKYERVRLGQGKPRSRYHAPVDF